MIKERSWGWLGLRTYQGPCWLMASCSLLWAFQTPHFGPKLTILLSVPGENILQQQPAHHLQSPPGRRCLCLCPAQDICKPQRRLGVWIPSTCCYWTKPTWPSSWLESAIKHGPIIDANAWGQIESLYRLSIIIVESMLENNNNGGFT